MDPHLYTIGLTVAAAFFMLSFIFATYRIVVGPNSMDRLLGLDGTVSMLQCAMATYICWSLDTTVSNAMIVVALLGFISSVSVARFRKRDGA
ncbi:monovalent cation/H+ antiporter complex subunit F [Corynebacterium callunae]|uniref:monovalent cation/H+ antiporter complex subunit F n=1 Tax=Corynebacterium callunae TaxID=1721 RepID=UPI0039822C8B